MIGLPVEDPATELEEDGTSAPRAHGLESRRAEAEVDGSVRGRHHTWRR